LAWRVPAEKIIANGYNLTLASLGLVKAGEKLITPSRRKILASRGREGTKILDIIEEMPKSLCWRKMAMQLDELPDGWESESLSFPFPYFLLFFFFFFFFFFSFFPLSRRAPEPRYSELVR